MHVLVGSSLYLWTTFRDEVVNGKGQVLLAKTEKGKIRAAKRKIEIGI